MKGRGVINKGSTLLAALSSNAFIQAGSSQRLLGAQGCNLKPVFQQGCKAATHHLVPATPPAGLAFPAFLELLSLNAKECASLFSGPDLL